MKVVTIYQYGSPEVLKLEEVPKPVVTPGKLLIRVKATAVTAADARIRGARFPKGFGILARLAFGITRPRTKILGSVFSGVVDQVGEGVNEFAAGDEVCGTTGVKMGTYAEYVVVSASKCVTKKPKKVSHADAAAMIFGGTTALYFVRDKMHVKKGDTVVINGASGAVGTNAVQLARYFGGTVTGVTSGDNAQLVTRLGAQAIIDYRKQSLVDSGKTFDVVIDAVGNISSRQVKQLITPNGRAALVVASLGQMLTAHGPVKTGTATEKKDDIEFLLGLMAEGKLKAVIDSTYKLKEIQKAHRRADTGQKVGNIVVMI